MIEYKTTVLDHKGFQWTFRCDPIKFGKQKNNFIVILNNQITTQCNMEKWIKLISIYMIFALASNILCKSTINRTKNPRITSRNFNDNNQISEVSVLFVQIKAVIFFWLMKLKQ
jgi:hypothetical protein